MNIKIFQSVIFIVAFFLFANFALAEEWVLYGSSKAGEKYYEKNSVKAAGNNIFKVWVLEVYNKEGKARDYMILKKKGKKVPANADELSYNSVIAEIDCAKKKIRAKSWSIYDNKKNVIYTAPKISDTWKNIDPKKTSEKLMKMVCESSKTSHTKKK